MKFLKKIETHRDDKKVVSARVPTVILDALENAAENLYGEYGYTFTTTRIIEKALEETLDEIKGETGFDFYELEKFKYEMRDLRDRLNESAEGLNLEFDESLADYVVTTFLAEKDDPKIDANMSEIIKRVEVGAREDMIASYKRFPKNSKGEK
ncbi:hypothetical protein HOB87_07700 [Candidatus Woesearchaeota archaeon]|jgi:hypothetical protein|nr:hypothetical protein [Candidatus Woesearchaeota archaeon]MBT7558856.1 hypothetical protein [Candidatus Woesearchaeota archaeon]